MELILAIFFGVVLVSQVYLDKSATKAAKTQYQRERTVKKSWINRVVNPELEGELKHSIENGTDYLEEVSPVYDTILDRKSLVDVYPRQYWPKPQKDWSAEDYERFAEDVCRRGHTRALRIMMAKRGFMPENDTVSNGFVKFRDENQDSGCLFAQTALDVLVLIWCADELKRHGVKGDFVASYGLYGTRDAHWNIDRGGV